MNKILSISILGLPFLLFSCDEKKEPVLYNSYRLSSIESDKDKYRQTFDYNEEGLIKRWEEHYGDSFGNTDIESSFKYDYDKRTIMISADEFLSDIDRRIFSDTLYLDDRGLARRAKGNVVIYHYDNYVSDSDYSYKIQKVYTADFKYDSSDQLIRINTSEKNSDFAGWEGQKSLDGYYEMKWKDGNLYESEAYYASPTSRLINRIEYSYYGGNTVEYIPILQTPTLRYFYLPLKYQGVFGKQSDYLVKGITHVYYGYNGETLTSYTDNYSYDISTTMHDSWIEAFSRVSQHNGEEIKCMVVWEPES